MMAQTLTLWITTLVRVVSGAGRTTESQYGQSGSQSAEGAVLSSEHSSLMAFHHLILLLRHLMSAWLFLLTLGPSYRPARCVVKTSCYICMLQLQHDSMQFNCDHMYIVSCGALYGQGCARRALRELGVQQKTRGGQRCAGKPVYWINLSQQQTSP